ncbi:MAG: DUF1700 domain-containing protein [Clostridioides sp.]|nr:DUF1700 domain-containing protein [Clostridioides sp.]
MKKSEFLEILRDYLVKDFSEDEVNDILRDYEEYFVDGKIEGKTEIEIIEELGSPKTIASEFKVNMQGDELSDKLINEKVLNTKINNAKSKIKRSSNSAGKWISDFASLVVDKITELLTIDIPRKGEAAKESYSTNRIFVFLGMTILTLALLFPFFWIVLFTVVIIGILAGAAICSVIFLPLIYKFSVVIPSLTTVMVFVYIAFIGFEILACQVMIFVVKQIIKFVKRYINWIKTRFIYVRASKRINLDKTQWAGKKGINKDVRISSEEVEVKGGHIDE